MDRRSAARAALAAVVALASAPACAGAHASVRPTGEIISFTSPDATSTNTLTVRTAGAQIAFHDPTVDGGIRVRDGGGACHALAVVDADTLDEIDAR